MRLLRLLSTGKSLVGLRDNEREFHVNDAALLPRFEGKKNPFKTTTLPTHPQSTSQGSAQVIIVEQPETSRAAVCEPVAQSAASSGPGAMTPRVQAVRPFSNWTTRFVQTTQAIRLAAAQRIGGLFKRKAPVDQKPQTTSESTQVELRLDEIKVIRNDLSDSDIEIVPRTDATVAASVAKGERKRVLAPEVLANTAWSRVSSRVFGPEKVS